MRYEFEVYNNWKYIKNADTMSMVKKSWRKESSTYECRKNNPAKMPWSKGW